jgi:hypothetical protein
MEQNLSRPTIPFKKNQGFPSKPLLFNAPESGAKSRPERNYQCLLKGIKNLHKEGFTEFRRIFARFEQ